MSSFAERRQMYLEYSSLSWQVGAEWILVPVPGAWRWCGAVGLLGGEADLRCWPRASQPGFILPRNMT